MTPVNACCAMLFLGFLIGILLGALIYHPWSRHEPPTFKQINKACRAFNTKYDELPAEEKEALVVAAEDWLRAWEEST